MTSAGRIKYERYFPQYGNKTRLGNWVEEQCHYKKEKHRHKSIYMQDYKPKPRSKIEVDTSSQRKGLGPRLLLDINGDLYTKNFASIYDLSYNHLPKIVPVERKWRLLAGKWNPEQDLTKNFGNITDYGISAYKKQIWDEQNMNIRGESKSEYSDSYVPPKPEDRRFKRWAVPAKNSSLLQGNNLDTTWLKLRDMPSFYVTPNEELVTVCREQRCNPITWECYGNVPKESKRLAK